MKLKELKCMYILVSAAYLDSISLTKMYLKQSYIRDYNYNIKVS